MCGVRKGVEAALLSAVLGVVAVTVGCATPGSPLPPSLHLPDRITDLGAVRTGAQVSLTWTMPKRTTDKLPVRADIPVKVCWTENTTECVPSGEQAFAPGAAATRTMPVPSALAAGPARPVRFYVEALSSAGRSAGRSNLAVILAGEAPAPVTGLAAELRRTGTVLHWTKADLGQEIRLHRTLLTPTPHGPQAGLLAPPAEPVSQDLLVERDTGVALDKSIRFGQSYEYTAERIARVQIEGKTLELAGEPSAPIRIDARDVFPPAIPGGLAAVATGAANGAPASVDLSWEPVAEPGVAGYYVYRREQESPWKRISGDQPLVAPAFHDTDVLAGHTYVYGVSAVDTRGNESGRSADASDTVPGADGSHSTGP